MKQSVVGSIAVLVLASCTSIFAEPMKALDQLLEEGKKQNIALPIDTPEQAGRFNIGGIHIGPGHNGGDNHGDHGGGFHPGGGGDHHGDHTGPWHPHPKPDPWHPHPKPDPWHPHPNPHPYPPQQMLCQGTFNGSLSNNIRISLTLSPSSFSNVGAVVDTHGGGTFYGNGRCDDRTGQFSVTVQWLNGPAIFTGTIWQNGYEATAQGYVNSGLTFNLVRR